MPPGNGGDHRPREFQISKWAQKKRKIPLGKKVVADRMYKDQVSSIRNPQDTAEVRKFKRRARSRHESFDGRLKNFKVLTEKFRNGHEKHKAFFETVCVLCSMSWRMDIHCLTSKTFHGRIRWQARICVNILETVALQCVVDSSIQG
jgi:hypothetical protein